MDDAGFRRATLAASLATTENDYARTRLAHYGRGGPGGWDDLPEWNPRTALISVDELAAPSSATSRGSWPAGSASLALPSNKDLDKDDAALMKLGEEAFFRYPVQLAPLGGAKLTAGLASASGLWLDPRRGVGGLVRTAMADGSVEVELTCATCHAAPNAAGRIVPGKPNAMLDLGAMASAGGGAGPAAGWGPGRVAVSPGESAAPVRIPDLRPTRWLTHLQADGAVIQHDVVSLAIRIETLIITAHQAVLRPPRAVTLALAKYLWSLGDEVPLTESQASSARAGRAVFEATCADCHAGPGLTGPPVTLEAVGTDPVAGQSRERGTGFYRVPSLRGVATRGPLLHDGTLSGAADLLDPERLMPGFARGLHGAGPVPGHRFGLDLNPERRTQLLDYLATL